MKHLSTTPPLLVAIAYEPRVQALTVEFEDGRVYRYCPVPKAIYCALRMSLSSGTHCQRHIKDRYQIEPLR